MKKIVAMSILILSIFAFVYKEYNNEIVNLATNTTYEAKVGLMYISDYGYAADPSAWTKTLYNYGTSPTPNKNWMYIGLNEWTITRVAGESSRSFMISTDGTIFQRYDKYMHAIRPTFYINSSVMKAGGDGTKSSPFRIN